MDSPLVLLFLGRTYSLPPLGEVPRSGKGGFVGSFELFPFIEQHPLSQPLRAASSPIGEPGASLPPLGVVLRAANQDSNDCRWQSYLRFVPRSGKGGDGGWLRSVHITTQPGTPPQSRFARQLPHWGAKGLAAPVGGGASHNPCCPRWGKCREAAKGV